MLRYSATRFPRSLTPFHHSTPFSPFSVSSRSLLATSHSAISHPHQPPAESLTESLKKRLPVVQSDVVQKRFDQLKRHHMQFLSMEINWNMYKPEQREEYLREIESLVENSYHSMSPEQQKAVSLSNIEAIDPTADFKRWDQILQKNEALQLGDWSKMSLDEKKAAYYLAWGPKAESKSKFHQGVFFRTAAFIFGAAGIYFSLLKYFRSKKDVPHLSPEWRETNRQRLIKERSNPYTGESAALFTKNGIKEA